MPNYRQLIQDSRFSPRKKRQLSLCVNVHKSDGDKKQLCLSHVMLDMCLMTTSSACTASIGICWLRPSNASSSAYRLTCATNFIATRNTRSRPSPGRVTSNSTWHTKHTTFTYLSTFSTIWQHSSVVYVWWTFLDPCLIYAWQVTTLWVNCMLLVSQLGQLSLPSLRSWLMSSNPCIYMEYGGGAWRSLKR